MPPDGSTEEYRLAIRDHIEKRSPQVSWSPNLLKLFGGDGLTTMYCYPGIPRAGLCGGGYPQVTPPVASAQRRAVRAHVPVCFGVGAVTDGFFRPLVSRQMEA